MGLKTFLSRLIFCLLPKLAKGKIHIFVPNYRIMSKITFRFFLFLVFSFGFSQAINAQWTSPGNGTTYTLNDLVEVSGCVSFDPAIYYYYITDDITISANDKLYINRNDGLIYITFANDYTITIKGSMEAMGQDEEHYLPIGMGSGHLRFEDASDPSFLSYCWFGEMNGIQIINSDVTFDTCRFHYFYSQQQSSAVNCMNCDPVFNNCEFYSNEGATIGSPANGQSSPQILNCQFTNNVTSNANQPQINLGPGAQDSIRIVNCTIEGGGHDMSGGIAIADLTGTGETKILLKNNEIRYNRYGYNQQGYNLSSVIVGNYFIDNNLETNPMNGGSGISIYGMNTNNKAKLRNNTISGNLWGITAIYYHDIDMGTEDDWGHNLIYGNGNGGTEYALYNNGYNDVTAIGNYWGGDEAFAESVIYHRPDLGETYGLVTYLPIYNPVPYPISLVATQEDNPQFSTDYQGVIDIESSRIDLFIPEDELSTLYIRLRLEIPYGTTSDFPFGEVVNLSMPFFFYIETPLGDSQWWTIYLNSNWNTDEIKEADFQVNYRKEQGQIEVQSVMQNASVSISNLMGQVLYSGYMDKHICIPAHDFPKGIYLVSISDRYHSNSRKVVVY